jgi:Uma2 family endonuclease
MVPLEVDGFHKQMRSSANRTTRPPNKPTRGEPSWDIALLYPAQGEWTEEAYLALEQNSKHTIELVDGFLDVLPVPDAYHQRLLKFLFRHLDDYVSAVRDGEVFFAPLPIRLGKGELREPDIVFLKSHRLKDSHEPPEGADLVMEILSPGKENRERDLKDKRRAYAKAKIAEYWIIDPEEQAITVLNLKARSYKTHGTYSRGATATSKLLPGFAVDVAQLFAAGLAT